MGLYSPERLAASSLADRSFPAAEPAAQIHLEVGTMTTWIIIALAALLGFLFFFYFWRY